MGNCTEAAYHFKTRLICSYEQFLRNWIWSAKLQGWNVTYLSYLVDNNIVLTFFSHDLIYFFFMNVFTSFFSCRTFDYGDTGSEVCRLSHHSTSTLLEIEEPYLEAEGATTFELGACYNVTVECKVLSFDWICSSFFLFCLLTR